MSALGGVLAVAFVVLGPLLVLAAVGRATTPAPDRPPRRTLTVGEVARSAARGWRHLVAQQARAMPRWLDDPWER